jgi:hypothetical protein
MISPEEIKKKALQWYPDYLAASVREEPFFPKDIRFGKVKASETLTHYREVKEWIARLVNGSRERLGYGYTVDFVVRKDRKTGEQKLPQRIWFSCEGDYLRFLDKEEEARAFKRDVREIIADLPRLREWSFANPLQIVENVGKWNGLLAVCKYFILHPKPNLYVRELPLELPTKFVEEHKFVLRQLLDALISEHVNHDESVFEKRFHLKYDEPLIRLMILDEDMARRCFSGLRDVSIPQSAFNTLSPACTNVLILENKTNFSNIINFLSLPELKRTVAIFGKGFQLGLLGNAAWIADKRIFYWGDIDVHGFQILSQLRASFPNVCSIMMDRETFQTFGNYLVTGAETNVARLPHLTQEENELFKLLMGLRESNRLEQEKISHQYAVRKIQHAISLNVH